MDRVPEVDWYGGFQTSGLLGLTVTLSKWEHLATTLDSSGIKNFHQRNFRYC